MECDIDKCVALNVSKANKEDIIRLNTRVDSLENEKEKSNITIALIDQKLESIEKTMIAFGKKIDSLINKPAKRWEHLTTTIIATGVGAIVMFMISQLL